MADRRKQMLELVQRAHAKQTRNDGRVPYWMHLLSVAQILDRALEQGGELADDVLREDLYVAGLGHDLYEDTAVQPDDVKLRFGERVDGWIRGMTNEGGDQQRAAYLARMTEAPEEVRLLKLADLTENSASVSYAIPDMGLAWARDVFLPIATEMRDVVHGTKFARYPRTAAMLGALLDHNYERLRRNIEMFELAEASAKKPGPGKQPNSGKAPAEITEEAWQRALERTRERERKEGERFPGKPFLIPDKDD